LDLIYSLANESNIKILAVELLLLAESAPEFRADLATKLCSVTERFAPNKRWHVDTILKVMSIAGQFVPDEVAANLITLIAATPGE
jgi:AP-1 complex subunit gamma-1